MYSPREMRVSEHLTLPLSTSHLDRMAFLWPCCLPHWISLP